MIKNKKGIQLNEAFVSILTLVLIAVLVIVALYLFGALGSTFPSSTTYSVANESGGYINTTGYQLSEYATDRTLSNVVVIDTDDNSTVASNLYTVNGTWYIFNATETTLTQIAISYDYSTGTDSAAYNATNDTVDQFATYPALIGLVGTIIFLGIVIGVLVSSFMPKNSP
jgi:hypothetical protein